jgi:hypothetical protein
MARSVLWVSVGQALYQINVGASKAVYSSVAYKTRRPPVGLEAVCAKDLDACLVDLVWGVRCRQSSLLYLLMEPRVDFVLTQFTMFKEIQTGVL